LKEALDMYQEAHRILESTLGSSNERVADIKFELGIISWKLKKFEQSLG
jgi:hypothetical protein